MLHCQLLRALYVSLQRVLGPDRRIKHQNEGGRVSSNFLALQKVAVANVQKYFASTSAFAQTTVLT